jgi:hypothetical protein
MRRRKLFALLGASAAAPAALSRLPAALATPPDAIPALLSPGYWNTISCEPFNSDVFTMRSSLLGRVTMYIARETLENLGLTPDEYLEIAEARALGGLNPLFSTNGGYPDV